MGEKTFASTDFNAFFSVSPCWCAEPALHKCLPPAAPPRGDVDWDNKGGLDCV